MSQECFDQHFGFNDFALQFGLGKIGKIRMSHGVASNLKNLGVEFAYLVVIQISGFAKKPCCEVEGRIKSKFAKNWRGRDEIGFAAIVEGDAYARFGWIAKSFADVQAAPTGAFEPCHLLAEGFQGQNVAHVSRLGLAEFAASEFEFMVHQEND